MSYSLITELCESHLISSRTALKKWDEKRLVDLCYLYFLALRILVADGETKSWAQQYCQKTIRNNNFDIWRTDGNDFYVLLYALNSDDEFENSKRSISVSSVRDWLIHSKNADFDARTQQLFNRLDAMFRVTNSSLKSMRRVITHWPDVKARERKEVMVKLLQQIKTLAPNSELIVHLQNIAHPTDDEDDDVNESASSGATSVASVATSVGGLGSGFNPSGDRGIYQTKKRKKSVIARR
jgi:hypothetical protein